MSGHSKWSTIKRQKQAGDIKRGLIFSKLANAITLAVRQGGTSDPGTNFKLRLAVEQARSANMPKENIERAVERGKGENAANLEEVIYEGFGPGGVSIIVEAATDNKLRTMQEIKNIFERGGGTLGGRGATLFLFEKAGQITLDASRKTPEEVLEMTVEAGGQDLEGEGPLFEIYTNPENLNEVKENLSQKGLTIKEAVLMYKPLTKVPVEDRGTANRLIQLTDKLEEIADVQNVYANFTIPTDFVT